MENFFNEFPKVDNATWKEAAILSLKGKPFEKLKTGTYEGIDLQPIYDGSEIDNKINDNQLPGVYPYLRGTDIAGYQVKSWYNCPEYNYTDAAEVNSHLKNDLKKGTNAALFDIAEKDKQGIVIAGKEDIDLIFNDVNTDGSSFLFKTNDPFRMLDILKDSSIFSNLAGGIMFDPFAFSLHKGLKIDHEKFFDKLAEEIRSKNNDDFSLISINASNILNSGGNAVQDIAYVSSAFTEIVSSLLDRDISIEKIVKNVKISFAFGPDFFIQIAKIRAFRLHIAKILAEFGNKEIARDVFVHAETASWNKSKLDVYNNMLRNTTEALSAILSGIQSLSIKFFDTNYGSPLEFSRRITRNASIVLEEECNLKDTADAVAGSWLVESLTTDLAKLAWKKFQKIESVGGISKYIESGKLQEDVAEIRAKRNNDIATRRYILVGVNKYPNADERIPKTSRYSIHEINSRVTESDLKENYVSGEIKGMEKWEPWKEFQTLRDTSNAYLDKIGKKPTIHFANFGSLRDYKARADFSSDFFKVGGFDIVSDRAFENSKDAVSYLGAENAGIVCICSTDELYEQHVEQLAREMKADNPSMVIILAGYPKDKIDDYKKAGVDEFIHVKANILQILKDLQKNIK